MDIVTSVPVQTRPLESLSVLVEPLYERIARRAFEKFVDRDCAHGYDLEDWLSAERALVFKPAHQVRVHGDDIVVDVTFPYSDELTITVYIAPFHVLVESVPDGQGRQIFLMIHLPHEICPDGVDAEQFRTSLRITAALAKAYEAELSEGVPKIEIHAQPKSGFAH